MWLSAKYLIGLVSVIQGLRLSDASDNHGLGELCMAKIISCDRYRKPFYLYKEKEIGMFAKIEDLNKACKEQAAYMRCIMRAENFCDRTAHPTIAEEMIESRRFPAEICRTASPWQQLYLKEARCLNAYSRKAFSHCIDKIVGIGNSHPDTLLRKCKYRKPVIDCYATVMEVKCGYYAGNILRKFLQFHNLSDYKCSELSPEDVDENFSSAPDYGITEAISDALEATVLGQDFDNEATQESFDTNSNVRGIKLDHLQSQISSEDSEQEAFTFFDFNPTLAEESLATTVYPLSDLLSFNVDSQKRIPETDKFEFPVLSKYHYVHKNRTTFALYEDSEMGHMKYMGCGEADIFWIILSPLRSKYCTLADLKSEYSEAMFKCTIRIDSPCSSELDDEDRNKKVEVVHHRYVATVLTPKNNQRSEDMAIMNVHYLKLYPSPSMYVTEKETYLWTTKANKANIEQTESVGRKGPLQLEDESMDILYQHGNGSGQKRDRVPSKSISLLKAYEHFKEYENWGDSYPLEENNIYFPEVHTNNIIYIEDDKGELISLNHHRTPIYSKSVYEPNSQFRPRSGEMPVSSDSQHFSEIGTKKDKLKSSIFNEQLFAFQDETLISNIKLDQQEHCSAEAPCAPNSEFISSFETKPGIYIMSHNIETIDPFKEMKLKKIPSAIKSNLDIDLKPYIISRNFYTVTPSTKIETPTEDIQAEEEPEDVFATDRYGYLSDEEINVIKKAHDSTYLDLDSSCVTSTQNSFDLKSDCRKPFSEYYIDSFTQLPYLYRNTDAKINLNNPINLKSGSSSEIESLLRRLSAKIIPNISKILFGKTEKHIKREPNDPINLKAGSSSSEIDLLLKEYSAKIIRKMPNILFGKTEKHIKQELLDIMLLLLERIERIFNI